MITFKTPATSANLGSGFDCLGIALKLYNIFQVERYDHNFLENIDEEYNNDNNLFLRAYRLGCETIGKYSPIHVIFDCHIPISRGLGSSASFIIGGLVAASVLHNNILSEAEIYRLACSIEGHPDNIAPCLYGGLCAGMKIDQKHFLSHKLPIHKDWKYTALVPNVEVSTEEARAALPDHYPRAKVATAISNAILTSQALQEGNLHLLSASTHDIIHEPYRKKLIPNFATIQQIVKEDTDGILLISGSGSTCLSIAKKELSTAARLKVASLPHHWQCLQLDVAYHGTEIER